MMRTPPFGAEKLLELQFSSEETNCYNGYQYWPWWTWFWPGGPPTNRQQNPRDNPFPMNWLDPGGGGNGTSPSPHCLPPTSSPHQHHHQRPSTPSNSYIYSQGSLDGMVSVLKELAEGWWAHGGPQRAINRNNNRNNNSNHPLNNHHHNQPDNDPTPPPQRVMPSSLTSHSSSVQILDDLLSEMESNNHHGVETLNNGGLSVSPPQNGGGGVSQRETSSSSMVVTQPASVPTSPLASPGGGGGGNNSGLLISSGGDGRGDDTIGSLTAFPLLSSSNTPPLSPRNSLDSKTTIPSSGSCISTVIVNTRDPNWQASKSSVRERNAAMFNNELMADVTFIVGTPGHSQRIPAHKYVLATGSSVFYAMFYGGLAENKKEIEVPDVEPSAFLIMLKYLYCDEIQLEADTVLATLYVAKKYIVPHLARKCVSYLETSLTAKNACLLLSQSRLFEEPDLMQRCWEVIDAQAEMALHSEGFCEIDSRTLSSVLGRETLNCKETALFEAALAWAGAECTRRDLDLTPSNRRAALGSALYLLRLPSMSLEEFADGPAQSGVLTHQETIDVFLHFTAAIKPHLSFPVKPRTGLKPQMCHRFQSCAYRSNQWRYRGRCDSIQFSVDRRIFMVGFGLYGSSNGASDYSARIELKRMGRVLAENTTKFFSDGSSNTFHVYFRHPVQIEPESYYTASAVLDGVELSYFGQEGMSEVTVGNVTFQFQCSSESTNGTGVQGGQIPDLVFYGPSPQLQNIDDH